MSERPSLVHAYAAQLASLPDGWFPRHGFLIVTVKHWSDGTVSAELPAADIKTGRYPIGRGVENFTEADVLAGLSKEIVCRARVAESPGFRGRRHANQLKALVDRPRGMIIDGQEIFA